DRIVIDLIRRDSPRRRLPAAIERASALDRAVYMAVAWEGSSLDPDQLAAMLRGRLERDPDAAEIAQAVKRVAARAPLERATSSRAADTVSLDGMEETGGHMSLADVAPTPEERLLLAEEERTRAALIAAVKAAAAALPTDERLYLQIVFSASETLPAREIAKMMGYPVEDVYRLKQRTQRWLKEVAARMDKFPG